MAFRDSASFGKRQEYVAVAELPKRGFDVYMTLVDDQQIDCIVRFDEDPPRYVDVQIKARSKGAKHPGTFAAMRVRRPRESFFFIFYSEAADCAMQKNCLKSLRGPQPPVPNSHVFMVAGLLEENCALKIRVSVVRFRPWHHLRPDKGYDEPDPPLAQSA